MRCKKQFARVKWNEREELKKNKKTSGKYYNFRRFTLRYYKTVEKGRAALAVINAQLPAALLDYCAVNVPPVINLIIFIWMERAGVSSFNHYSSCSTEYFILCTYLPTYLPTASDQWYLYIHVCVCMRRQLRNLIILLT